MGLADIVESALESRTVREAIGNRVFKNSFEDKQTTSDGENNIVTWIWNAASRLVGFLVSEAGKLLSFTLTGLWSLFVSTAQFIWNFDWNMSDQSIDQQIQARWNALGGMLGGTLGNAIGYLGCGVLPGATIFAFNEPLGAYVLKNVAEEMAEEFLSNLAGLVRYTFQSAAQSLILWGFKNIRKFIKSNSGLIGRLFGDRAEKLVKAWGAEGSKPWSFASAVEDWVESIPNEFVRNFVEEFLEESWEGCVEAGYVVANSVDSYIASEKLKKQLLPPLGENKYVEIKPDRTIDDQRIVLAGPEEALKPVIVQTLTNYQQMQDKNIGILYGTPPQTNIKDRRFKPHVYFYFKQSKADKPLDQKSALDMEISLRLIDKKSEDFTDFTYIDILAQKIKTKFAKPVFQVKKGNQPYYYNDPKGYLQTTIWGESLAEAKRIIEAILDIVGVNPDWQKLRPISPAEGTVSLIPEKMTILGEVEEMPVKGKSGTVSFVESWLLLYGKDEPISLVDLSGKRMNPRVTAD